MGFCRSGNEFGSLNTKYLSLVKHLGVELVVTDGSASFGKVSLGNLAEHRLLTDYIRLFLIVVWYVCGSTIYVSGYICRHEHSMELLV